MWQECANGVVLCVLAWSSSRSCVALLEPAVGAQSAESIVVISTLGSSLLLRACPASFLACALQPFGGSHVLRVGGSPG
eukprot:4855133-Alexandrium_andersonii.AAC.1